MAVRGASSFCPSAASLFLFRTRPALPSFSFVSSIYSLVVVVSIVLRSSLLSDSTTAAAAAFTSHGTGRRSYLRRTNSRRKPGLRNSRVGRPVLRCRFVEGDACSAKVDRDPRALSLRSRPLRSALGIDFLTKFVGVKFESSQSSSSRA